MKKLVILKSLTTLFYISSIIGLIVGVPFVIIMLFMPGEIPFDIKGSPAAATDLHTLLSVTALFVGLPFFTYALYLFKKVLDLFGKNKIFNDDVIKYLSRIGKSIIIGYFIMALPYMIYGSFIDNELTVQLSPREAGLVIVAGLFFMVLSEVFSIAKNIKQENDLTI
jgi:hypothetical protein